MSDICFEGLKILVMVAVLVLTRYVLPWVKSKAGFREVEPGGSVGV